MDSHHIGPHTVDRFEDWQAGRNLSAATIKRRRVALSLHPDAGGDPAKFAMLTKAKEVLGG